MRKSIIVLMVTLVGAVGLSVLLDDTYGIIFFSIGMIAFPILLAHEEKK